MARAARALGWTMAEVRAHSYRDLAAMRQVLVDEARKRRMARAARR